MTSNDDSFQLEADQPPSRVRSRSQSRSANYGHGTSGSKSMLGAEKSREDALRQELASVKKVNEAIEGVLQSLEKAKANMTTVNGTVNAASQLLNTWTRILSQTEHNQRVILDPSWQGASQDIADIEEEAQAKQYAAERREIEEQERKATAARRAEEEERRRAEAAAATAGRASKATTRGRGRGVSRGASTSTASTPATSSGNTSMLRAPSTSSRRGTTGGGQQIGRARGLRGKT